MPCTLTDIASLFTCAQTRVPFAEMLTVTVFFIFFILFKAYPLRESLPASLFITTIVAGIFYGMGLISSVIPIAAIILLGLSAVFLHSQNTIS